MAGSFDKTFGTSGPGYTFNSFGSGDSEYLAQVIDSNNNIYVTGNITINNINNLVLAKYTNTGALDKTFGAGKGYIIGDYYTGKVSYGNSLVLDSTGNVIVTGYVYDNNGAQRLLLAKYKSNGELDKSFGGGKGWQTSDFGYSAEEYSSSGSSLALDRSGNIVVTGDVHKTVDARDIILLILARYKPNGILDSSFGGDGKGWVNIKISGASSSGYALIIDNKTGSIISTFENVLDNYYGGIIKFTSNGILDKNFGDGKGYIYAFDSDYVVSGEGSTIKLDTSGNILLTGGGGDRNSKKPGIILVRYKSNGELDTSFGENKGYTITSVENETSSGKSLVIDNTGSIVVLGISGGETLAKSLLVRYDSNGITDSTFGNNGIAQIDFQICFSSQVSLDNDNRLVVCGDAGDVPKKLGGLFVARFLNTHTAPICLVAGTPIVTDQGIVPIEQIDPKKHTINHKRIVAVTKTFSPEKHLISFDAHSMGINCPSQRTIMTSGHQVLYRGTMLQAKNFLGRMNGIRTIPYSGKDILYNVLQEEHGLMRVNNMVLETLHPENKIAKQILNQEL